ncbi:Thiolase, N-terminal domain-containing protein [Xylogone sp. PMI_703]|nr:Thiolase, N-terminal domain-containing protein [Xylogone sp. PMI_703]
MATQRLDSVLKHLRPVPNGLSEVLQKNPDDVVITLALRTPLTRGFKGGFKDTEFISIVYELLKVVREKAGFDPNLIEDICIGNVANDPSAHVARAAALAAGLPESSGTSSVNRFCASGLKAIQDVASQIILGSIDIGVAVGAESMTKDVNINPNLPKDVMKVQCAADTLQPMGQTSENVSYDFNVSRESQDRYATESFRRAEAAQKAGWFDDEIVPIPVEIKDPKTGEIQKITLTKDEGPRWGTTYESLSKIRPAFPQWGVHSTGGNSSQVTDGAAAVILMRRSTAKRLGLPIMAKFCGATVTGLAPRIMGIGPSIAIPKLLRKLNLSLDDIDLIEMNEAFASMAVYCHDVLKLDPAKVNVRGGAIALGHPLGATGVRQVVTGLSEARRQKAKTLLTTMCAGTGQGMAGLFVNEQ